MKGTVKFFNVGKGFGFIAGEDGKEYFVHKTGLKEGTTLNENDAVTFDVEEGDRGPKAANVAKEGSEAAPESSEAAPESSEAAPESSEAAPESSEEEKSE